MRVDENLATFERLPHPYNVIYCLNLERCILEIPVDSADC